MSEQKTDDRRSCFRLRYPQAERPILLIAGREYAVLDLSEFGARIAVGTDGGIDLLMPLAGTLRLAGGDHLRVDGAAVWVDGGQAAIRFTTGISLRRMLAEQRRLLAKYPARHDG